MEDASDTIFEATTTSMKILNHFKEKYDFDPVQPSQLINKFGYSMALQGRDEFKRQRNCMILDGEINSIRIVMFTK